MHIGLHSHIPPYDQEMIEELILDDIPYSAARAKKEFYYLIKNNEEVVFHNLRNNIDNTHQTKASLQLILQSHWARVYMLSTQQTLVNIRIGSNEKELEVSRKQLYQYQSWLSGYYYAMICRAKDALAQFKQVDFSPYFPQEVVYTTYHLSYHAFLSALGNDLDGDLQHLAKVEAAIEHIPHTYAYLISLPIKLWRPLLENSPSVFNKKLEAVLQEHKKIWSGKDENGEDRSNDSIGHRNLAITAIMSYAHDKGIPIEVTSDYTPQALVEGKYLVDLDTQLSFYY